MKKRKKRVQIFPFFFNTIATAIRTTIIATRVPRIAFDGIPPVVPVPVGALFDDGELLVPAGFFWPAGEFGLAPVEPTCVPAGFPGLDDPCVTGGVAGTDRTGNPPADDGDEPEAAPERLDGARVGGEAGAVLLSAEISSFVRFPGTYGTAWDAWTPLTRNVTVGVPFANA